MSRASPGVRGRSQSIPIATVQRHVNQESPQLGSSAVRQSSEEAFYSGALGRIRRCMLILAPLIAALTAWRIDVRFALGLLGGAAIAYLNFVWLERTVAALADRVTQTEQPATRGRSAGIVLRFLARYVIVAAAAYAIFRSSRGALGGLLTGLFLPVAAIFCEAFYEVAVALRRSN